jgi:hypothetical protein
MLTKVQGEPNIAALSYVGQQITENSKVPFCMIFASMFWGQSPGAVTLY